jgi:hypothetical protein
VSIGWRLDLGQKQTLLALRDQISVDTCERFTQDWPHLCTITTIILAIWLEINRLSGSETGKKGVVPFRDFVAREAQLVQVFLEPEGSGFAGSVEAITPQGQSDSYTYQLTLDGKPATLTNTIQIDEVGSSRVNDLEFTATGKIRASCIFILPCRVWRRQNHDQHAQRHKPARQRRNAACQAPMASRTQAALYLSGPEYEIHGAAQLHQRIV